MTEQVATVFRFIINPQAGRRDGTYLKEKIEQVFFKAGSFDCQTVITEEPGHATRLSREFARQFGDRVVVLACGGDGTAREVATGLIGSKAAMGILPIGTANDFARYALSTCDLDRLLPLLPWPEIRPIDAIAIDDEVSLNITSLGFDTKVLQKARILSRRWRWLGSTAYTFAIGWAIFGKRQYGIDYVLDVVGSDGQIEKVSGSSKAILSAICNGQYYGGGFNPAPTARIDDGLLYFSLIDNLPLWQIIPLIPQYKKGTHLDHAAVRGWTVTAGEVRGNGEMLLGNFDGDQFSKDKISFRVLPSSLHFAFY